MLTSLLTRIPFLHPRAKDQDPGFDTFIATLRARRSSVEWCKAGPEGDLYRLQCLAEEMTLLGERNYGLGHGNGGYGHGCQSMKDEAIASTCVAGTMV